MCTNIFGMAVACYVLAFLFRDTRIGDSLLGSAAIFTVAWFVALIVSIFR